MKTIRHGLLLAFVLALPIVLALAYGTMRFGQPLAAIAQLRGQLLYIRESDRDLGPLEAHTTKIVSVSVLNMQSHPVEIVGAKSSCGCAKIEGLPKTIKPHSTDELTFVITPSDAEAGKEIRQSVLLLLDYPGEPNLLRFRGTVAAR